MNICILVTDLQAAESLAVNLRRAGHSISVIRFILEKERSLPEKIGDNLIVRLIYNALRFRFKNARSLFSIMRSAKIINYGGPTDSPDLTAIIKNLNTDIVIQKVGFILKDNILSAPVTGVLNDHIAHLPYFRGRSAMEWTILHGKKTGSTVHFIDRGVDTGDILKIYDNDIGEFTDNLAAKAYLFSLADKKFIEIIALLGGDKIKPLPQKEEDGKQFFEMHPLLVNHVNKMLETGFYRDSMSNETFNL
ncbi:MAG: hypothetical protein M1269_13110 [Chloroflexi bacterium]|nr:hypothetical protein [Chloroflexota bacterium]